MKGNVHIAVILLMMTSGLHAQVPTLDAKIYGMLIGSAIGDAAGGPLEFVAPPERSYWSCTDEAIGPEGIEELGSLFRLRDYTLDAQPYAQFEPAAPAGSITDDTRWKMIFVNSLKKSRKPDKISFAESYWEFQNSLPKKYVPICKEWQEEYGYVMNHYLGLHPSYPPERIWGGIPTMAGQMPFLPVAARYPGSPSEAYKACWNVNILDLSYAKDITAAIVAGLSQCLTEGAPWDEVINAIYTTDPYKFDEVPWVPRKVTFYMDMASDLVSRSEGVVKELFNLLEEELDAVTWWEAHVPLVVCFAFLEIAAYDPLAALQLCMEFGHDTDSYAQLVGAFVGAINGFEIFDPEMIDLVNLRMREQYGQDVNDWMRVIEFERTLEQTVY